jgi:hypothetical protein
MTPIQATLRLDTITMEDRAVLERVLGTPLEEVRTIQVRNKPEVVEELTEEEAETLVAQFGKVFDGFTDEELAEFDASIRRTPPRKGRSIS